MSDKNVVAEKDQLYKLRHSAAHVMAQAVLELFPEAKFAIGPPIDTGFYYDFDLGRDESRQGALLHAGRSGNHREAHAPDHRGQVPVHLSPGERRRGAPALRRPAVQARAHRRAGKGRRGRVRQRGGGQARHQHLPTGYLRGSLPGSPRGAHRPDSPRQLQADDRGRRVLAWRRAQPHAAAHLRHGVAQQEGTQRISPDARRGQEARPPQARARAGDLHLRRGGRPRPAPLAAQRRHPHLGTGEARLRGGGQGRLSTRAHAAPDEGRSLHPQRPPALLRRQHVPARWSWRGCATT